MRRGLERHVVGRRVTGVEVGRERVVRRTSRDALVQGMTNVVITGVRRRGKYLVLDLDSGWAAMVHLRMSGQLLMAEARAPRPPHTHVVWHLAAGADQAPAELWFVDPRTFGEVVVFDPDEIERDLPELARLGPDPVAEGLTASELARILRGRRRRLKALLLDQHVIAGIGNIYADEILHRARLHPDRLGSSLTHRQVGRLHEAMHGILAEAIEAGGSTLRDAQYVGVTGEGGDFQTSHRVYGRTGEPCLTCGRSRIVRRTEGGRGTHLCPWCQRRAAAPAGGRAGNRRAARSTR